MKVNHVVTEKVGWRDVGNAVASVGDAFMGTNTAKLDTRSGPERKNNSMVQELFKKVFSEYENRSKILKPILMDLPDLNDQKIEVKNMVSKYILDVFKVSLDDLQSNDFTQASKLITATRTEILDDGKLLKDNKIVKRALLSLLMMYIENKATETSPATFSPYGIDPGDAFKMQAIEFVEDRYVFTFDSEPDKFYEIEKYNDADNKEHYLMGKAITSQNERAALDGLADQMQKFEAERLGPGDQFVFDLTKKIEESSQYNDILEDGSDEYFLARLRDRIVMQEYSVIIENDE